MKFLKYFDLWGWENDRILESVRPVVVRVVGTAACCVPGLGRSSCGCTSQHPGLTGELLEIRRAGSDTRAGGGSLEQGSFSLDASIPLGFFLWVVGLVVERPKANFESRGGHLLVKCLCLESLGETWFSPGMMNHRRCLLRESARSDIVAWHSTRPWAAPGALVPFLLEKNS